MAHCKPTPLGRFAARPVYDAVMKRALAKTAAIASLLLFGGVLALWVRSYFILDQWNWFRGVDCWTGEVERGRVWVVSSRGEVDEGWWVAYRPRGAGRRVGSGTWWRVRGGGSRLPQVGCGGRRGGGLGIWPGVLAWRRLRRGPVAGLGGVCGYDLRATPERCPECGTAGGEVNHRWTQMHTDAQRCTARKTDMR